MIKRLFATFLLLVASNNTLAYGDLGHKMVAAAAWPQLSPYAKHKVQQILGFGKEDFIDASVWADHIKSNPEFNYLKPLHYVNLAKGASQYNKQRDCADGQCVVEAIHKYSGHAQSDSQQEQVVGLRMLIHLIADLHQPLHAGFSHDRGGNWYDVKYKGSRINLHKFWDHVLPKRLSEEWQTGATKIMQVPSGVEVGTPELWATHSHGLVKHWVYKADENQEVSDAYLEKADEISKRQLSLAAWRLAMWLNKLW